MTRKAYILALFLMVSTLSFGQVEFTAKVNKEKVALNEQFKITFEMNENGDDFRPPEFKDFKIVSGPMQSISQSWVNGVSKFSKTYTFYLQPKERGNFTIGQAEVIIDETIYKTSPVAVEVTAAVDEPKDGDNKPIKDVTDGIHLVTEVSKTQPYLNEGINVVYKLYVSADAAISNWRFSDIPRFSNFWSHDFPIKEFKVQYGSYQGDQDYRYVVLKRTVLYPQKSGELVIEPLTLNVVVDVPTNRRDIFGRRLYESEEKTIASKSQTIDVKALPQKDKPADFTGAVGDFKIETKTSKDALEVEESMDVQVTVSGRGNLKLFQLPELQTPRAFETYSPESSENIHTDFQGMKGSITDTYTLIPNSAGDYTLDPVSFSYFDPNSGTYKRINTDSLEIKVKGGAPSSAIASGEETTSQQDQGFVRKPVTAGKQFRYIKLRTHLHAINQAPFFKSTLFWSLLTLPVILLPVFILVGGKFKDKTQDLAAGKKRRANRLAQQYLSEAKRRIGDQAAYYEALERALHNYLKAKLKMPTSEITKPRILETLKERNVAEETSMEFVNLLEACEFARYAPPSQVDMQQDYENAMGIIAQVDKQLKG
ncbi:MAG TPA: BatD family protein [Flavobacteriaceae bacterium]|nr:BatD family protein [Flavobacteriaceae bacterium]